MRVVIAPDSFKGSLTALEVAREIEIGWKESQPEAHCDLVPLADGGEGTVSALVDATGGERIELEVDGPYGHPTLATYGLLDQPGPARRAVVEMSSASGLHLRTDPGTMSPLRATSAGTGQLIADALDRGARHIILGLGGSATNDGGTGMLRALGIRFLDTSGRELEPGGAALANLGSIDSSGMNPLVAECRFELASDVDNPLCGPNGATATFGPQKGATEADVKTLDQALAHFAEVAGRQSTDDISIARGAGAAGGMGFGALAFLDADIRPGIEVVIEAVNLRTILVGADLLITGEGRIDRQTLAGKTPFGAMQAAQEAGVPTVAIVGSVGEGAEEVISSGMTAIFGIVPEPMDLATAIQGTKANLRRTAQNVAALWGARS